MFALIKALMKFIGLCVFVGFLLFIFFALIAGLSGAAAEFLGIVVGLAFCIMFFAWLAKH